MKILMLDDQQLMLDAVSGALSASGHEVATACTYDDAAALLDDGFVPSAVVCDYDLEDVDGRTGTDFLREVESRYGGQDAGGPVRVLWSALPREVEPGVYFVAKTDPSRLQQLCTERIA